MLEISNLTVAYDRLPALREATLSAAGQRITTIVGRNGAGKSTLLRAISGLLKPLSGEIRFLGERIDSAPPARIVGLGISQVPEGRELFPRMSVYDNLMTGAYPRRDAGGVRRDLDRVYHYFPVLQQKARVPARNLSGGQQQMLAFARALMSGPRMLLLDEPSTGLAPAVERDIMDRLQAIAREDALGVLLVEQNAALALAIAEQGYVLELGSVVLQGPARALMDDPSVRSAYLGL